MPSRHPPLGTTMRSAVHVGARERVQEERRTQQAAQEASGGEACMHAPKVRRARGSHTRADTGTEKVAVLVKVASTPPSCAHESHPLHPCPCTCTRTQTHRTRTIHRHACCTGAPGLEARAPSPGASARQAKEHLMRQERGLMGCSCAASRPQGRREETRPCWRAGPVPQSPSGSLPPRPVPAFLHPTACAHDVPQTEPRRSVSTRSRRGRGTAQRTHERCSARAACVHAHVKRLQDVLHQLRGLGGVPALWQRKARRAAV